MQIKKESPSASLNRKPSFLSMSIHSEKMKPISEKTLIPESHVELSGPKEICSLKKANKDIRNDPFAADDHTLNVQKIIVDIHENKYLPISDISMLAPVIMSDLDKRIRLSLGPSTPVSTQGMRMELVHFHKPSVKESNFPSIDTGKKEENFIQIPSISSPTMKYAYNTSTQNPSSEQRNLNTSVPVFNFSNLPELPLSQELPDEEMLDQKINNLPIFTRILNLLDRVHEYSHLLLQEIKKDLVTNTTQLAKIEGYILAQEAFHVYHSECHGRAASIIKK